MSRLRSVVKQAIGLGDKTFTENDFSFSQSSNQIIMTLINEQLLKHDNNTQGHYHNFINNELGFIDYVIEEYNSDEINNKKIKEGLCSVITINCIEIRKEYNNTNAVWVLFEYLMREIINPEINQYGAGHVAITATFSNNKLSGIIPEFMSKYVKGAVWIEDTDLEESPYTGSKDNNILNAEIQNRLNNANGDLCYPCAIYANGDIAMNIAPTDIRDFPSKGILPLVCDLDNNKLSFRCSIKELARKVNLNNFITNIQYFNIQPNIAVKCGNKTYKTFDSFLELLNKELKV